MSKSKNAVLLRQIQQYAVSIHEKCPGLEEVGKKDVEVIHRHLRKALKRIERNLPRVKRASKAKVPKDGKPVTVPVKRAKPAAKPASAAE